MNLFQVGSKAKDCDDLYLVSNVDHKLLNVAIQMLTNNTFPFDTLTFKYTMSPFIPPHPPYDPTDKSGSVKMQP